MPTGGETPQSGVYLPAPALANSRYNRQMLIPSISLRGQEQISSRRVLIIGLGGLGSPAALYLAGSGVHTLGLLDHDVVEESNLHRQIVHRESSLLDHSSTVPQAASAPLTKVQSAMRGCRELNSTIEYRTHEVRLHGANALDIIHDYDIVLDCTDNPATRYLISDVCVVLGKTLVSGAAQRLDGQIMVLNYPILPESDLSTIKNGENIGSSDEFRRRGPCYRCVFPVPPSPEMVQGCSEIGILGPVVGTIGCLMVSETLRLICRPEETRKPTMLLYNAWSLDPRSTFRTIGLRGRRPECISCGIPQVLKSKGIRKLDETQIREGTMDYEVFCGKLEDVCVLQDDERVSAATFLATTQANDKYVVVDVREKAEVEMGPKVHGSINIPMSTILRNGSRVGQTASMVWDEVINNPEDDPVYFVCQRGNDSQIAARKLQEYIQERRDEPRWIGDVKGGFIAMERQVREN